MSAQWLLKLQQNPNANDGFPIKAIYQPYGLIKTILHQ